MAKKNEMVQTANANEVSQLNVNPLISGSLMGNVLAAKSRFDDAIKTTETTAKDGTTVIDTSLIIGADKDGNPIIIRDRNALGWIATIGKLDAMDVKANHIKCVALADMRKNKVHEKSGFKSFAKFAETVFPEKNGKTLDLWANIADTFLVAVYDDNGTPVNVDYVSPLLEGFRVGTLQVLLAMAKDENYGLEVIYDAIRHGDITPNMKDKDVQKWAVEERESGKNKPEETSDEKPEKEGAKKFDMETASGSEYTGIINDYMVNLMETIKAAKKRDFVMSAESEDMLRELLDMCEWYVEHMNDFALNDRESE